VQGRLFTPQDDADAPRVAVVNESFVRARFPDGSPLGRRIKLGGLKSEEEWLEIVGVVPDLGLVQVNEEERESPAGFYVPLAQSNEQFVSISASVDGDPMALTGPVREAVVAADADTPIYFVNTCRPGSTRTSGSTASSADSSRCSAGPLSSWRRRASTG
jgi:hypothetical protein